MPYDGDKVIADFFTAMPALRELRFEKSLFGSMAFEALRTRIENEPHTLRVLDLTGSRAVASYMIQRLLEDATQLEEIHAEVIHATDIVRGRPWACTLTLKKLDIGLDMGALTLNNWIPIKGETSKEETARIMKAKEVGLVKKREDIVSLISTLTQLEHLCLVLRSNKKQATILNMDLGLDRLKGLRRMESLGRRPIIMKWEELLWMLDHWPRIDEGYIFLTDYGDKLSPELASKKSKLAERGLAIYNAQEYWEQDKDYY